MRQRFRRISQAGVEPATDLGSINDISSVGSCSTERLLPFLQRETSVSEETI
jgi:hypothetical protein